MIKDMNDEDYQDDGDRLYDEMINDFFMIACDADRENFVRRWGQRLYDDIMKHYLGRGKQ